ncbi:aminoglycoside phosphotransferase family protein (plasmid) [Deinococcus sp. KNUC1210]|uniref:aminoglycoside phosphotransferase family protein n=1 Tax=Deinococcus sp. KNUC1210 TaxID=2917691 RepID=UPI001EF052F9|nr:aminoglycoside phosphotransferase family protein [Deinococcus sp. KNUC1210]ULH14067.1 aminoglycoside phosphotransferase family protein [Deinococcus sp. KNUC1210]
MSEHPGAGLFDRGIHIEDGIVRRPRGYWSTAVHDLLHWLDRAGFGLSPKPVQLDAHFEYLRFVDGADQAWPLLPLIQSLEGARAAGVFARRLESTLATYEAPERARWQLPTTTPVQGPVQHGDVGPWNLLWDSERGEICGLIDWDLAGPGPAGYDSGVLAWFMVPVMDDARAYQRGFGTPIDRAARLRAYCDGYGVSCNEMLDRVMAAQQELSNRILSASEDDPPTYAALKKLDLVEQFRGDMEFALNWKHQGVGRDAG